MTEMVTRSIRFGLIGALALGALSQVPRTHRRVNATASATHPTTCCSPFI